MSDKIIIKNESKASMIVAMHCVEDVIRQGRISKSQYGNCFSFATQFTKDSLVVYAELRKSGTIRFRICNR